MTMQRIQKVLAAAGVGSRRECETYISEGRVQVDGQRIDELGAKVDPDTQELKLDGEVVNTGRRATYLLNKPRGVICSAKGRPDLPMVTDYVPPEVGDQRMFTIGRLDVESEGAILLTNDGELCHLVSHPRFQVQKTYRVEVEGVPDAATLQRMRKGVWLSEGRTSPLRIRIIARRRDRAVLEVQVREGMKREIRRVCARFGHEVRRLQRVAIGPVQLGQLPVGATRPLTPEEERSLRESADVVIRLGSPRPQRQMNARRLGQGHFGETKSGQGASRSGAERGPRGGRSGNAGARRRSR